MIKIKSYNKAIQYLFSRLPMYQRQGPKAFKKDLTNIKALLKALGHPEQSLKAIHIAGTNGKGTVSHIIAGCLMTQGYRIGLYTSPHYRDFRERVKINGVLIPKRTVIRYVNQFRELVEEVRPSFFEMTVAMAFLYFQEEKVDYAVIETGLGGRLDSTNVIRPILSVITNISLDHTQFLGDTIPRIAREKAGIIKKDVPVLIGEKQEETTPIFSEVAQNRNAPLHFAQEMVSMDHGQVKSGDKVIVKSLDIDMGGPFLERNLITSLAAIQLLKNEGVRISWKALEDEMKNLAQRVKYLGRWQWIDRNPDVLVDSAHNIGGITELLINLPLSKYRDVHFVLGFVNDKNILPILQLFPKDAHYYWAKANIPRGLNADKLREAGLDAGLIGRRYSSIRKALAAARTKADKRDLIFVGGSIFTVAEVV